MYYIFYYIILCCLFFMLLNINVLLCWFFSCVYNMLSQLLQNDNFKCVCLAGGRYSSGWQRILVQLVAACSLRLVDMGAVCSCRARLGIRKELGGFLSSADRTDSGLKGLLSALCIV